MPSLTQLEYIVAVDEYKSFSKAAKECHVSQPSLSSQIQKVEDILGIILFDRSKKPILTTQKGLLIVKQALQVLREHRKIYHIKNNNDEVSGELRLGVIPTLASYVIPLFVESFSKRYPKVNLKISEYQTDDLIYALNRDRLDVGLLVTPLKDDSIIERSLFFEKFYIFSSKENHLFNLELISESDLDGESAWLLDEGHCFRDQVIKVCSLAKQKQVLNNVNFTSGSLETLINLIRRGKGYTLLPELATFALSEKEKAQNLKEFVEPIPTREVSLVHSRSFYKQELIDALEKEILTNLPESLKVLKKDNLKIIDFK